MVVLTNEARPYGEPTLVRKCMRCKQPRWRGEFATIYTKRCTPCTEKAHKHICKSCGGPAGVNARDEPRMFCTKPECLEAAIRHRGKVSGIKRHRRALSAKTHECPVCGVRKPRTHENFVILKRDENGNPLKYQTWCRDCKNAIRRERYRSDPQLRGEYAKRDAERRARERQRRAVDPEYDAQVKAQRREWERLARERRAAAAATVTDEPQRHSSGTGPEVPAGPLSAVIDAWIEREELNDLAAAEHLGVSDKRLREWRHPGRKTRLSIADACLLGLEMNWHEVWSEEEYPEVAKIWQGER